VLGHHAPLEDHHEARLGGVADRLVRVRAELEPQDPGPTGHCAAGHRFRLGGRPEHLDGIEGDVDVLEAAVDLLTEDLAART
jgi:hypothetical protein